MSQALINLLIALALLGGETHAGFAPHYAPKLMGKVAARRGLEPAACMVSSPRYAIGTWVEVWGVQTKRLRHCKVVDVSAPQHRAGHLARKIEVELSWENARELCGETDGPSRDCPIVVYRVNE